MDIAIRDTMGLTPEENKSLKTIGALIGRPKIEVPSCVYGNMASYAITNPIAYYNYAMNDADIVVTFCSELFGRNRSIPVTLSSATAKVMKQKIKEYFGVKSEEEYDRLYRGLELIDDGIIPDPKDSLKYLKATRYTSIRSNPDAKLVSEAYAEAYVGGFNSSFNVGWYKNKTFDYDLQNAYLTAMANIIDIDWEKPVEDFPRDYNPTLEDFPNPLTPAVAICDYIFPDNVYCPNIPTPVKGGINIYPLQGNNVYLTGPDIFLALKLGATITIKRGFRCAILEKNGVPSKCLAHAVSGLVQDRNIAKRLYPDKPIIEKSLKIMGASCYGMTAQNVSPKTRYNAQIQGREPGRPSSVTSPYHASYTTALTRCMLIACINQLHEMGWIVYSVTTDGFITNAPLKVVENLDAFGFTDIFQNGRYTLNKTTVDCKENHVWAMKHYNDELLNITTRGNVGINNEGVLAHNSYATGEEKDSLADREAFIYNVLDREGKLSFKTDNWTRFSIIAEKKELFHVTKAIRHSSMNFDYRRCPITETAIDTPVKYECLDSQRTIETVCATFDTRPFKDIEEYHNYKKAVTNEPCIKTVEDLERIEVKASVDFKGYIGKNLDRKILLSILMGFRAGLYEIPSLKGLKQAEAVQVVNSWNISEISISDWKNCSRTNRQENMLPYEIIEPMLKTILEKCN